MFNVNFGFSRLRILLGIFLLNAILYSSLSHAEDSTPNPLPSPTTDQSGESAEAPPAKPAHQPGPEGPGVELSGRSLHSAPLSSGVPPRPEGRGLPRFDDNNEGDALPDIEAKAFPVKIFKRSTSNRVYLLDDPDNHQPKPGRLLLLKRDEEPIMAFRILKTYPDDKRIAAKRIKRYKNRQILDVGDSYTALEKLADIITTPSIQDNADLKELEASGDTQPKVKAYDPELDAPVTPHDENPEAPSEEQDETDSHLAVTVEEVNILDHHRHWLSAGFGYVRNNGPPNVGGSYLFTAGNIRYALTLAQMVFFDRAHLQDSIAVESGFYLYKSINFQTQGDAYTVLSLAGALRYNLIFSESLGVFVYGGIMQSNVIGATGSQADSLAALNSILPVVGGGFLFQVGPSWYTRVDIGLDSISLNLVLRF